MMEQNNTYKLFDTLIFNLETTSRVAKTNATRFFDSEENIQITFNEYTIIDAIYANPKIHQRDLAKLLFKGTANLSRDIEKLVQRGIIKQNLDAKGKRIVKSLMLTPSGERLYHDTNTLVCSHITEFENVFSEEECKQFIVYLEKLRTQLTKSTDMFFE